jgi:ATP-dependent DNA helicase RecQ
MQLLAQRPELPKPQAVIPIPSSKSRSFEPVRELAVQLAARLAIPALIDSLGKTRETRQQKELNTLIAKQNNISGVFVFRGKVNGRHLLLVDDLYDSGATLREAACTIGKGHPASIVVLTLTKSIQSNV